MPVVYDRKFSVFLRLFKNQFNFDLRQINIFTINKEMFKQYVPIKANIWILPLKIRTNQFSGLMTPEGKIYHLNWGIKKLRFKIENCKNVVILRFAKYFNHVVEEILTQKRARYKVFKVF